VVAIYETPGHLLNACRVPSLLAELPFVLGFHALIDVSKTCKF
jgi:hypothetical protein